MLWNKYKTNKKQSVQNEWKMFKNGQKLSQRCLFCHRERALGVPENAQIGSEYVHVCK